MPTADFPRDRRNSRLAVGVLALTAACAHAPLPADPPTAALYRDLQRLVTLSEAAGWDIDRIEVEELLPDALMSTCRVDENRRHALRAWLDARIAAAGGDPRAELARHRGDLDRIDGLLELWRIRMALSRAMSAASADCPFWIAPEPAFSGLQLLDDRWLLSFGGGGKAILVAQGDRTDLNFGGAGRVLFGRAFGRRWALLAGLEAGASASFPRDEAGERGSLVLGIDVVTPVAVRYRLVNSYLEFETGALVIGREGDGEDAEPGIHVGIAVGGTASRRRWFLPGVAFGVSYERTFPDGVDEPLTMVKLGLRAAIDIPF